MDPNLVKEREQTKMELEEVVCIFLWLTFCLWKDEARERNEIYLVSVLCFRGRYNDSDESSYAVKMNGLPYEANEDDVHSFFGEVQSR